MRRLPPLNAIRAFEAAGRHVSFAKAADELGVTSTAISHQIKLLEDTLGTTLFRRTPRPVVLTAEGRALLPKISASFDAMVEAFSTLGDEARERPMRISVTVAFASGVLVPILSEWAEDHPDIELDIHASDDPVDLVTDDVDAAIRYISRPDDDDLTWFEIAKDQYTPMASPALLEDGQSDSAFQKPFPLITYQCEGINPTWQAWQDRETDDLKPWLDPERARTIRLSEETHAIDAAVNGQGVVLASTAITKMYRERGQLKRLSEQTASGLTYFLVRPRAKDANENVTLFGNWLKDRLAGPRP